MATNATIETLLNRRSIRKFKDEPIDDDATATLETVAQHAASSQFLNDWSAIRVSDPAIKARLAEIGNQPYIATAPLLYVFVIDEHRNARIAQRKGIDPTSDEFHLKYSLSLHSGPERRRAGSARHGDRGLLAGSRRRDSRLAAQ